MRNSLSQSVFNKHFVVGVIVTTVMLLLGGFAAAYTSPTHAVAVQSMTGTWYLKKDGRTEWTRKIIGRESTDLEGEYAASVVVQIYPKEGARSDNLIVISENEKVEQHPGKGKFRSIYVGTFNGSKGNGTYYNNDGESGEFTLTRK